MAIRILEPDEKLAGQWFLVSWETLEKLMRREQPVLLGPDENIVSVRQDERGTLVCIRQTP